jgi:hypothetical protein
VVETKDLTAIRCASFTGDRRNHDRIRMIKRWERSPARPGLSFPFISNLIGNRCPSSSGLDSVISASALRSNDHEPSRKAARLGLRPTWPPCEKSRLAVQLVLLPARGPKRHHGGKRHGVKQPRIGWQCRRAKHGTIPLQVANGHDMGAVPANGGRTSRCSSSQEPVHGKVC